MSNEAESTQQRLNNSSQIELKVYKKRWIILLIYIFYSAVNSFQWMEYCIITNIIVKYYNVSTIAVDWTSIIYMALYPLLVVPASYIIDKYGLRTAALIGGLGTTLEVVVKLFSIEPSLFFVVLIGQAIGSAAQVFILCLPSKIAAAWFSPNEVSTACSLGIFGTQLGFALGFVMPSAIVKNHEYNDEIGSELRILSWSLVVVMIPVSVAILWLFQDLPKLPPSTLQYEERQNPPKDFKVFLKSFKQLMSDKAFILHLTAYGINVAVFSSIGTFINQFVLYYLPEAEDHVGPMGCLMVIVGMGGSVIFGFILDKTRRFKESTLFIYVFGSVSIAMFLFALERRDLKLIYATLAIFGFFANAYMPVGFEFAVELTHPLNEGTTTGMLNAMTQGLGVLTTIALGEFNSNFGPSIAILSQGILMMIGAFITMYVPNTLKRQKALQRTQALL